MKGGSNIVANSSKFILKSNNRYYILASKSKEDSTMATAINYQLSMFGAFNITPSPDTITLLMPKINQETQAIFLPSVINSQQIEIPSNRVTTIPNLAFITPDQQYNITILNERIDVTYFKINDADISLEDFYEFAIKALSAIIECSGVISNRLAMNIQQVCEMKSSSALDSKGKALLKCAPYYADREFSEWSMRTNSQVGVQINESKEELNVITEVSSGRNVIGQKDVVLFHIDINTLSQNQNMRFGKGELNLFVQRAKSIAMPLIKEVERLIVNE